MHVFGYGIELRRLAIDDIELVRFHRNSKSIQQYMEYREEISEAQQLKWFDSINNIYNNYFVIVVDNKKVGLIYGANINWDKKETQNGGIFIWEKAVMNTTVPLAASLLLTDTSILLGLKKTYIKVLKTNKLAISFNKSLGYQLLSNQENKANQQYVLDVNMYRKKSAILSSKIFDKNVSSNSEIEFISKNEINQFYINLINQQPKENKLGFTIR